LRQIIQLWKLIDRSRLLGRSHSPRQTSGAGIQAKNPASSLIEELKRELFPFRNRLNH
jgi:hypothetical protein